MKRLLVALALFVTWTLFSSPGIHAQAFYAGKTIRIVVGLPAGDAYDLYARMYAQHMPKYIPGNPNMIIQNMPGAATLIAANYVFSVAKPDGLTLGSSLPSIYFDQLVGRREAKFDYAKFTWIGSPERSNQLLYMRADAPYKTIEDVREAATPPRCGSTGTGSPSYHIPKLLEETIGAKFNIVTGYQGGQEIDLAVERGEVQCRSFTITTFFAREPFHTWRKKGFVRVLVQTGQKRDRRLPDVPTIYELMDKYKTPEAARQLAAVVLANGDLGRPIMAPPGIPTDRVKILRDAFAKALRDPELLAEAKKKRLEIDPVSAEEIAALAKKLTTQPLEIVEQIRRLLGR